MLTLLISTYLEEELKLYLQGIKITSNDIGDIRRRLFVPWDSKWNGLVRILTAELENK